MALALALIFAPLSERAPAKGAFSLSGSVGWRGLRIAGGSETPPQSESDLAAEGPLLVLRRICKALVQISIDAGAQHVKIKVSFAHLCSPFPESTIRQMAQYCEAKRFSQRLPRRKYVYTMLL